MVRSVCLLVVAWRYTEQWPLIVGGNRDEWLDRPATAVTVLRDEGPRILGGRDERAGGTWMAVNQNGVVCGLTNRPMAEGPDPNKQSRGRLPLVAAVASTAVEAAELLATEAAAGSYNPAWILVGDRQSLHYLPIGPDESPEPQELAPGLYVLENAALGIPSVKVDHVRATVLDATARRPLWEVLPALLGEHVVTGMPDEVPRFPDGRERMVATLAPCVHADGYGTRSSTMVRVAEDPSELPQLLVADGPPCTARFVDAGDLWSANPCG
jgi:uncharacterized protein with NRDE domain